MKEDHMRNGQLKPAYNPQISIENQFITHVSIHQTTNDTNTLESHLNSFDENYNRQSKEVVADAGYGSEENYEMLKNKQIEPFVKYNYFHAKQKKKLKENPFLVQNLFYNQQYDFYICPMRQKIENIGTGKRIFSNGYESEVTYYQAKRCVGCPLRSLCHKAKGNRKIEVNHHLNYLKNEAKELLNSKIGLHFLELKW
ncbi:transposase [Flavobacterium covae]|uniref:transposase n=1 Tax=Flavobacterium covae TaxID=2906076 RepID=UPI0035E428C5